jgi:xanthine dehydrogenase iron-sulfur cluster and FAD-binding subunit A
VAPVTVRARHVEQAIVGRKLGEAGLAADAARAVRQDIAPIDDVRSTGAYRQRIAERLVGAFVAPDPA